MYNKAIITIQSMMTPRIHIILRMLWKKAMIMVKSFQMVYCQKLMGAFPESMKAAAQKAINQCEGETIEGEQGTYDTGIRHSTLNV